MKSKYILLLLAAAGTLSLAGCQKTGLFSTGGGEIRFSATASPAGTKTVYGATTVAGEEGLPIWQSIDWEAGDQIRIYSDNAVRRVGYEQGKKADELYHWADYGLTDIKAGSANNEAGWSSATLVNLNNDGQYTEDQVGPNDLGNGLMWPAGVGSANFFAIYPASRVNSGISTDEGPGTTAKENGDLAGINGEFPLTIPDTQFFSEKGNLSSYGFMTAFGKGAQPANDAKTNIKLEFKPAFTAFEISIRSAAEPIGLSQFKLVSDNAQQMLAGDFTAMLNEYGTRMYDCTTADKSEIVVNLSGQTAPGANENKPDLTFTVLALPQDFNKLHVEFTKSTGATRKLALKYADSETAVGDYVNFAACRKHRIYGLALPNGEMLISVGTAPWVAGDDYTFSTIENITTGFVSVKRYDKDGNPDTWGDSRIAIAKGIEGEVPVDPENPDGDKITTNRPLHSPMFTLHTVSVGVPLELRSDNPNFKFVVPDPADPRKYLARSATLRIRASENIDDEVTTEYFVVAEEATEGDTANIRLVRTDPGYEGVPVAYSHSDLPGSNDHTKVPFILLSGADYNAAPTITPSK
jgi:hypothetical protein